MAKFERGDQVEVCCKDEGFHNAFYPATIISEIIDNNKNHLYIVQYNTLLTDDEQFPYRDFISAVDLRPVPPEVKVSDFDLKDEVDVYANEGWWKGKVKSKSKEPETGSGRRRGRGRPKAVMYYYVSFEFNGLEIEVDKYLFDDLRVHHDWIHGKWFCSKKIFR